MGRTLAQLLVQARSIFGKSDYDLESQITDLIKDELRSICSDYPYWFLAVEPGTLVPAAFSGYASSGDVGSKLAGRWLDQGWMITQPGVEYYQMYVANTPAVGTPSNFVACEVACLNHVKSFQHNGAFKMDYGVGNSNMYLSRGSLSGNPAPNMGGMAYCYTINSTSYLRINPIPTDYEILSVSFQLALPPWYASGSSEMSLMSEYYPDLLKYLMLLQYAEWFDEPGREGKFLERLYGSTDRGIVRSDIPKAGLVGKMKTDSERRYGQQIEEIPHFHSSMETVGRDGYFPHRAGASYYIGPPGY